MIENPEFLVLELIKHPNLPVTCRGQRESYLIV